MIFNDFLIKVKTKETAALHFMDLSNHSAFMVYNTMKDKKKLTELYQHKQTRK